MSRKICWIMMFLLAGLVLFTACQKQETIGINAEMNGVPYHVVSVAELQTMLENKDFFMVNVHIPWQGDIPQTDLRLSYAEIEQNLDQLPEDRESRLLVYCLTSGMAKKAVATLTGQGYTNVWMLDGGTTAWEEAELPLNKEP